MQFYDLFSVGQVPAGVHSPFDGSRLSNAGDFGALALALYASLWAYDGWYVIYPSNVYYVYTFSVFLGTI